ncbi:MAG: TonB-dependent receptor plug domain-containing protein [Parabacteroides sp.]|nr:TonB-dependent receptor plug domain-containing protein [Parabacteroides sp.]
MKRKKKHTHPHKIGCLAMCLVLCMGGFSAHALPVSFTSETSITQQNRIVTGVVKDHAGELIIEASIVVKGTTIGVMTDVDGKFTLNVPDNAILEISYIGYKSQVLPVNNKTNFNIILEEDSQNIDEVVVIGYGTRSKRDVTTAISNVGSEVIGKSISMSAENAMQGTMSGVQVSGTTGDPMSRPTIRIRGTNTWGVSDPLYVVDGIAITEMGAGIEGNDERIKDVRGPLNIMTMIDPNDIESISVLKDASAAAIYGVRAANGVVLITTKKDVKINRL